MKRPDTTRSAESESGERDRVEKPAGDPLHDAIVEGTRLAISPPGDARPDLIDAAISHLEPRKRQLERRPARWEVAIAGFLVGLAMFAFLVGRMTEAGTAPVLLRALLSVVGGGLVAAYLWKRDRAR